MEIKRPYRKVRRIRKFQVSVGRGEVHAEPLVRKHDELIVMVRSEHCFQQLLAVVAHTRLPSVQYCPVKRDSHVKTSRGRASRRRLVYNKPRDFRHMMSNDVVLGPRPAGATAAGSQILAESTGADVRKDACRRSEERRVGKESRGRWWRR